MPNVFNVNDDIDRAELLPPASYTGGTTVEDCEDAWNEVSPTGGTITAGAPNKVVGTNCVKIAMAANAAVGIIASEVITTTDLSGMKYLTCYIMCTIGVAAGDLQLCIDNTAQCASPVKAIDIPALRANVMNFVVLPLGTSGTGQNAIISVGLKMVTDLGACDVYIDHVQAWPDYPTTGDGVDVSGYMGRGKLVLSMTGNSAGTTKTLDVAIQQSDYAHSGFAAMSPAKAFTQRTDVDGAEEIEIDLDACKRYIKAVATLGSANCVYTLECALYAIKSVRP